MPSDYLPSQTGMLEAESMVLAMVGDHAYFSGTCKAAAPAQLDISGG